MKIKRLIVENFNNIEFIDINIEGNIVKIDGSNESGKTSLVKAVEVALLDVDSNKAYNYIQDGKDYFRVIVYFDSGDIVEKYKSRKGRSYVKLNGEVVKPDIVREKLGLFFISDLNESLNFRYYNYPLLFIDTSDGDNYRILYNALKLDFIVKINKEITDRLIKLKNERESLEIQANTLSNEVKQLNTRISSEDCDELKRHLEDLKDIKEKVNKFEIIKKSKEDIQMLCSDINKEFEEIDEVLANIYFSIYNKINELQELTLFEQKLSWVDNINEIDESVVSLFNLIKELKTNYSDLDVYDVPEFKFIKEDVANVMLKIYEIRNNILDIENEESTIEVQIKELSNRINKLTSDGKIIECPNCGELIPLLN